MDILLALGVSPSMMMAGVCLGLTAALALVVCFILFSAGRVYAQ